MDRFAERFVPGLLTVTLARTPEEATTVYNCSDDAAAGWLNFWYQNARDGVFSSLHISENGVTHTGCPVDVISVGKKYGVCAYRCIGSQFAIAHAMDYLECIRDYGQALLRSRQKEGRSRVTCLFVDRQPLKVPVRSAEVAMAQALYELSDPFAERTLPEVLAAIMPTVQEVLKR